MSISEIISYCVSALASCITIVSSIVALHKKGYKAKVYSIITNIASYVSQAEATFGAGCGPAKLQWVLTKVQYDCVKQKVDIDEAVIVREVENILSTPQKKTDNETTETRTDVRE